MWGGGGAGLWGEAHESSPRAVLRAVVGACQGLQGWGGHWGGAQPGTWAQGPGEAMQEGMLAEMTMLRLEGHLNPEGQGEVSCQRGSCLWLWRWGMKKAFPGPSQGQGSLCSEKSVR